MKEHFLLLLPSRAKQLPYPAPSTKDTPDSSKIHLEKHPAVRMNTNLPAHVAEIWPEQKDGCKYEQESASNYSALPRDEKLALHDTECERCCLSASSSGNFNYTGGIFHRDRSHSQTSSAITSSDYMVFSTPPAPSTTLGMSSLGKSCTDCTYHTRLS